MKKKLFGNHLAKDCAYCQNGIGHGNGKWGCSKKREPSKAEACRGFCYDPLKRAPRKKPVLPDFSPDDFAL